MLKALALGAKAVMVRMPLLSESEQGLFAIGHARAVPPVSEEEPNRGQFVRSDEDERVRLQVGRPVLYGLAARGEAGARHVIEMLNKELELAMALCGCRSVAEVTRAHVQTEGDRIRALL